jgi:hypothetical protein
MDGLFGIRLLSTRRNQIGRVNWRLASGHSLTLPWVSLPNHLLNLRIGLEWGFVRFRHAIRVPPAGLLRPSSNLPRALGANEALLFAVIL